MVGKIGTLIIQIQKQMPNLLDYHSQNKRALLNIETEMFCKRYIIGKMFKRTVSDFVICQRSICFCSLERKPKKTVDITSVGLKRLNLRLQEYSLDLILLYVTTN